MQVNLLMIILALLVLALHNTSLRKCDGSTILTVATVALLVKGTTGWGIAIIGATIVVFFSIAIARVRTTKGQTP